MLSILSASLPSADFNCFHDLNIINKKIISDNLDCFYREGVRNSRMKNTQIKTKKIEFNFHFVYYHEEK